jgi:DNA-binding phage protein
MGGTSNPNVKLSPALVAFARYLVDGGTRMRDVAAAFGVHRETIGRALAGKHGWSK